MADEHSEVARGHALLQLGRPAEAEQRARHALAAEPESASLLALLAVALQAQDRASEAVAPARAAVQLDPSDAQHLILLAHVLAESGQRPEAETLATRAVHLAPDDWLAHLTVAALALDNGGRGQLSLADRAAYHATTLAPLEADAHNMFGLIRLRLGEDRVAEQAFRHALSLDPDHALAQLNLAEVQSGRVDMKSAADTITRALAQHPQERELHAGLDRTLAISWAYAAAGVTAWALLAGGVCLAIDTSLSQRGSLGRATLVVASALLVQVWVRLPSGAWRRPLPGGAGPTHPLLYVAWASMLVTLPVWFGSRPAAVAAWWVLMAEGVIAVLFVVVVLVAGGRAVASGRRED